MQEANQKESNLNINEKVKEIKIVTWETEEHVGVLTILRVLTIFFRISSSELYLKNTSSNKISA